jgi:transcriptional repressor NrdR
MAHDTPVTDRPGAATSNFPGVAHVLRRVRPVACAERETELRLNTTSSSYIAVVRPQVVEQGVTRSFGRRGGDGVFCPFCRHPDSRVIDSRTADDGAAIRRRRSCPECGRRFTTQESVILMVGKRSGATEPFTRDKIVRGVRRACQGRPVSEDQLAILAQQVEETIRARGCAEVPSHDVGLAILGPLRELDEVAYLRFASVYRGFESLADFEDEIASLRSARQPVGALTP